MSTIISFYSPENDQTLILTTETENDDKLIEYTKDLRHNGYVGITAHKTMTLKPLKTFPVLGV